MIISSPLSDYQSFALFVTRRHCSVVVARCKTRRTATKTLSVWVWVELVPSWCLAGAKTPKGLKPNRGSPIEPLLRQTVCHLSPHFVEVFLHRKCIVPKHVFFASLEGVCLPRGLCACVMTTTSSRG